MRIHRCLPAIFAAMLLALSACGDQPLVTSATEADPAGGGLTPAPASSIGTRGQPLRIAIAPPPRPISADEVRRDLQWREKVPPYTLENFPTLLSLFTAARTHGAYQYLSAEALGLALPQPEPVRAGLLRRLVHAQSRAHFASGVLPPAKLEAECMVDFDNPDILATLPDTAVYTYAPHYHQWCASPGLIRVEPMQHGHFHLNYENPEIGCIDLVTFRFGYGPPGANPCPPIEDPSTEPRYLASHNGLQVIKIWRSLGSIAAPMTFSLESFANMGGEPVKVRFYKGDGTWNQFNHLGGYTLWDLSPWVRDVVEVQILHAFNDPECGPDWITSGPGGGCPPYGGPFSIDYLAINP